MSRIYNNEYIYDDIDRLAGVTYLDSETEGFVMDDLGNLSNEYCIVIND